MGNKVSPETTNNNDSKKETEVKKDEKPSKIPKIIVSAIFLFLLGLGLYNRDIVILITIVFFSLLAIFFINTNRPMSKTLASASIFSCMLIIFLYLILKRTVLNTETEDGCHYDLYNPEVCPDPNGYCEEEIKNTADDRCVKWCYAACPGYDENERLCTFPEEGLCDKTPNPTPCYYKNLNQPACRDLKCSAEINDVLENVPGCTMENLALGLNTPADCKISYECNVYCYGDGKYTDTCINFYCTYNFLEYENIGLDNRCYTICNDEDNKRLDDETCAYYCGIDADGLGLCACVDLQSDDCESYCEDKNPSEYSVCKQRICEITPSDPICLEKCTVNNQNNSQCQWGCFSCIPLLIQSVYDGSYISVNTYGSEGLTGITGTVCTVKYKQKATTIEIIPYVENDLVSFTIYQEGIECPSDDIFVSRLGGNETYKMIYAPFSSSDYTQLENTLFILESTGIENTYLIKTNNTYPVGGINGFEGFKHKYLTLNCDGITLSFYSSVPYLQQWRITDIDGLSPCVCNEIGSKACTEYCKDKDIDEYPNCYLNLCYNDPDNDLC